VILTATDANGCTDTATQTIYVINDSAAWVPNVFTPNGDGKNDIFNLIGKGISEIDAHIFNRWGTEIYNWSSMSNGWNGKNSGSDSPEGVYYYLIKLKYSSGKHATLNGTVTLIR
jgi:gliding motility-associated-like protein